jgi:ABC-type cobalamin transport system ATPase subunit
MGLGEYVEAALIAKAGQQRRLFAFELEAEEPMKVVPLHMPFPRISHEWERLSGELRGWMGLMGLDYDISVSLLNNSAGLWQHVAWAAAVAQRHPKLVPLFFHMRIPVTSI